MKLLIKSVFLLSIAATLLCSCSEISKQSVSVAEGQLPKYDANVEVSVADSVLNENTAPFRMALKSEVTVYGSGNSKGFYEIFSNDDNSKNVMYTDYETQRQIYLCSQPNCLHNNESCTSWIKPEEQTVYPVALNQGIAFLYSGRDSFSKIEIADANGANRRVLTEFGSGVDIEPGAAVNDDFIVVKVNAYTMKDDGQVNTAQSLVAVSLKNGEKYKLYSTDEIQNLSPGEVGYVSLFFRGVTDTGFIVKTIRVNDYTVDEDMNVDTAFDAASAAQEHTIFEVPFDGSEVKTLLTFHQDECFEEPYGDSLFYLKNNGEKQYSLERLNTQTMEHTTIISDFLETNLKTGISQAAFSDTFLVERVGDFVILNTLSESSKNNNADMELIYQSYAVNINNGELKELTLGNYYNAMQMPITILAQTEQDVLVHAKVENIETEGAFLATERSMALMTKEDYLKSEPAYRMIDTLRKPM